MKRKRFTEEQIIGILNEHEAGVSAADLARKHGFAEGSAVLDIEDCLAHFRRQMVVRYLPAGHPCERSVEFYRGARKDQVKHQPENVDGCGNLEHQNP